MFMYLEQEVLFNMMHDKSQEAFHLVEPVFYFMNGTFDSGKLGFSFVGLGVLIIMAVLAFILFRMAHNEKKERYEMEQRKKEDKE